MSDVSAAHAEASALGAVLIGGDLDTARQTLPEPTDPHGWTVEGHWTLWRAILDVAERCDRPDTVAVVQRLMDEGKIEHVGGASAVSDLAAAAPAPSTLKSWAATVADRAHRRRMSAAARRVIEACADLDRDPAGAVVELDAILDDTPTDGGLRIVHGDQLDSLPEPQWLVDRRLQRGTVVLWGHEESGKSFVALDLTAARAHGNSWHGMTVRPGRTIYLAAEGHHGAAQRLKAAFDARGTPSDKRRKVALSDEPLDLGSSRDLAQLDTTIADHGADLVVLDTWARLAGLQDENDSAQAGRVVKQLDRIRHRHNCDVLIVHHARKDGESMRGSSALPAAMDTGVRVSKSGDMIKAASTKVKDGPAWTEAVTWRLRQVKGAAILERPSDRMSEVDADQAVAQVMAALRTGPVLQGNVIRTHGKSVLARVKQDTHVDIDEDDRGRPILVGRTPL